MNHLYFLCSINYNNNNDSECNLVYIFDFNIINMIVNIFLTIIYLRNLVYINYLIAMLLFILVLF